MLPVCMNSEPGVRLSGSFHVEPGVRLSGSFHVNQASDYPVHFM